MNNITFDDFKKLHIRIGTVRSVGVVENADKLLQFSIDVGEEFPRTIISGIREYFPDIDSLVGVQVPVLLNLEPRVIRGIESQGMILAIGEGDGFTLLTPNKEVREGADVR